MPNKASKARHKPIRTCVICRRKELKEQSIRFIMMKKNFIIDNTQNLPSRGYYLCNNNYCILKLDKWLNKYSKKKQNDH